MATAVVVAGASARPPAAGSGKRAEAGNVKPEAANNVRPANAVHRLEVAMEGPAEKWVDLLLRGLVRDARLLEVDARLNVRPGATRANLPCTASNRRIARRSHGVHRISGTCRTFDEARAIECRATDMRMASR